MIIAKPVHGDELAMPATDQKQQVWKGAGLRQAGRQGMAFQMIDRNEGLARRHGERLSCHHADHHPADQAGSAGRGNCVELIEGDTALFQGLRHQPIRDISMRARRDFRHHAAIRCMFVNLRAHGFRQDLNPPVRHAAQHGSRGLVAAGLNAKQGHRISHGRDIGGSTAAENQLSPAKPI